MKFHYLLSLSLIEFIFISTYLIVYMNLKFYICEKNFLGKIQIPFIKKKFLKIS